VVATQSLLVVANEVTQAANYKRLLIPMLEKLRALPKTLGRTEWLLADSGYLSQANVEHCVATKIQPLTAMKRERHHVGWRGRFAAAAKAPSASAMPMQTMTHRLKTPTSRTLCALALRKQTPEPVFGM
jgi:hypothetical protein